MFLDGLNTYSLVLFTTALINFVLAIYALRFIKSPGTLAYCILLLCISIYSFGYAFELKSENLQDIKFWVNFEFLGISFLPTAFIILALQYTGWGHYLKSWLVIMLLLFSLATLIFQYTNYNNLFYKELKLSNTAPFPLADFKMGIWFWVFQAYTNFILLISCLLYLLMVIESKGINRMRASIMLLSSVIPWTFYIVYLSGHSPYNIELSPFSFSIVGILGALGMFRYNLFEFVPMAFENVFNSITDGVVILDTKKRLVNYNNSALSFIPQLVTSKKGQNVDAAFINFPVLANLINCIELDTEIIQGEIKKYFHVRSVAVNNDRKQLLGWTIIFTDITERKLRENNLLEIEKNLKELNYSKDKFLAIIAHDLRNSFHLMINMTDMIIHNIEHDNKQGALKKSKIIYDTSVTTYNLLQNLLEWALIQQQNVKFKPHNLTIVQLLEEEIHNLHAYAEQKELTIGHTIEPQLKVYGDQDMLKTVFRNLLSNAIKYSFTGGKIRISGSVVNNVVTIEFTDNGTGMTQEEQEKLFRIDSSFSKKGTASENGTGLGLLLCKEFIQMHGGNIWVKSTPDAGSTFTFTIPVAQDK
jgi:signal transduction histidine kinase